MKSQWFELKDKAIVLRKKGLSIRYIENKLKIPRSTLSGWLRNIKLSKTQKEKLLNDWRGGLAKARKRSAFVHREQGNNRRKIIRKEVDDFVSNINIDKNIGELILATFYLAEGTKRENSFIIANSSPELLKSLINLLRYLYKIDESKFRCCLHLRKDQIEEDLKNYWSSLLNISKSQFLKTQFDKRTVKKTYEHYKGVCVVIYHDMALQRRVLYLGEKIISITTKMRD